MSLKDLLSQIDEDVLESLLTVAYQALNDVFTIDAVADECDMPREQVAALAGLAFELAQGEQPCVTRMDQLEAAAAKIRDDLAAQIALQAGDLG